MCPWAPYQPGSTATLFQSVEWLLSLLQVRLVYIVSPLEVRDRVPASALFFRAFLSQLKAVYLTAIIFKFIYSFFLLIMKTCKHFLAQSVLRLYQVIWPMDTFKEAAAFIVRIITLPATAATSFLVMITSPVQKTEPGMVHLLCV